ncbi:MAG: hypothetical protein P8M72_13210 [Gammaproteobacteria bacterium]|nr:hypothetical protein [Gammaproteobacteria bacterium]
MDTSSTESGKFYFNYTAEVHEIGDLVQGSSEINDETNRERSSLSQVFSGSYGISDHWTISALVSHVEHKRRIGLSFKGEQRSSGIGDSVILIRYSPFYITPFSRNELSVGLGVRLPTGDNEAGGVIALSEDMQPGTGANGTILWGSYSHSFNQPGTWQFHSSLNYTFNEGNDRKYSFGDQFNLASGVSWHNSNKLGLSGTLRYRWTNADERSGFTIPNTGGQWLDFVPAIQYTVNDKFGISLSGRIPLKRELEGVLQFTTSYSYALAFSYAY